MNTVLSRSKQIIQTRKCLANNIICSRLFSKEPVETKKLFTPGPLGISEATKQSMMRDIGSRESEFIEIIKNIRNKLVSLAGSTVDKYTCVPIQGSGTFAIEAFFSTIVPKSNAKVLILENGAYGKRQETICKILEIPYKTLSFETGTPITITEVKRELDNDEYTHVTIVHCETSAGVLNPIDTVGQLVKDKNPDCIYFVDAMSSFGAVPLNVDELKIDYMVSSSNKCLEGSPGFAYVIAKRNHLESCKGQARSLVMDLVDQYEGLEKDGQFRFTPPTHSILAFNQALLEHSKEGGVQSRAKRYHDNNIIIRKKMEQMGFKESVKPEYSSYIISSFQYPQHPNFSFPVFYEKLNNRGQVIYPGKLLNQDCFRLGNIGHLYTEDMEHLAKCIEEVLEEMNIAIPLKE